MESIYIIICIPIFISFIYYHYYVYKNDIILYRKREQRKDLFYYLSIILRIKFYICLEATVVIIDFNSLRLLFFMSTVILIKLKVHHFKLRLNYVPYE